jgi:hypothetical protein
MAGMSTFESRKGSLACSPEELFGFSTDLRNFSRFIPDGTITDLELDHEKCNFKISSLGQVSLNIAEKLPFTNVTYHGTLFGSNEFSLIMNINRRPEGKAEVVVRLEAMLNPILKMMASQYVDRFLETLIDGMEKFNDWNS